MKNLFLLVILWCFSFTGTAQTIEYYQTGEEFAGPFPSWKNVKTDYGAKGDGTTDDTQAIQNALNAMKTVNSNTWSVLYFPAGTYRITSTLKTLRTEHNDYLGISIIGEDPATTTLLWDGASNQFMFSLDAWYAKVGRLTFDGKGKVSTGLVRDGGFSTYCELNDLFFKDMSVGISLGGPSDQGQAEHAIERCRFTRCSFAGIETNNFNVIDIYVWSSLFEDCGRGIHNNAGSYNAVDNVFLRSKVADLSSDNSMTFVILNNTSIDSKTFMRFNAGLSHVQGNKIYNTIDAVAIPASNPYGGAATLIGNLIKSRSGNTGSAITAPYGNQIAVDNTFTVSNPISSGGRFFNATQSIVSPSTIVVPSVIKLPGTPPNKGRKVFEVKLGTGNDANEIQQKINLAAAEADGTNPVIHIPKGKLSINTTIVVPTKQIQIVGDGGNEHSTVINWSGSGVGPGFRFLGPSRATMRDMYINFGGSTSADPIIVENSDQVGGRIFCDQVLSGGNSSGSKCLNAILVDGVENSDFTYINGGWGEYTNAGVLVRGGTTLSAGGATNGQVSLLLGALGNNENKIIDVENGGRVLAYGFRNETPVSGTILNLGPTKGTVSVAGMSWAATPSNTTPFINIDGFKGSLAYVGNGIGTGYGETPGSLFIKIAGDGSNANILSAGNIFQSKESTTVAGVWKDSSSPKANATILNSSGGGLNEELQNIPNVVNQVVNTTPNTDFVLNTLSQIRNLRVSPITTKPSGVTDLRLIRLFIRAGNGRTGLTLKSDGGGSSGGNVAPLVNISSPANNAAFTAGSSITINTTASDSDGTISKVEFYQGAVKLGEDTTSPYSFVWNNVTAGKYSLTAKAIDNNALVTTSSIINITVSATSTGSAYTILTTQIPLSLGNDQPYELGMKFTSSETGTITKIRYYKMSGETGTHTGRIWSSTGTQLSSVVFSSETASGWQEATLATPLSINANTTYVVSVNSNTNYAITNNGLASAITNGPLSSIVGANGVFNITPGLFPANSFNNSNYFRDIVFVNGTTSSGSGLSATYYDNKDFTNVAVSRIDKTVNFDWGTAAPTPSMGIDQFSVRWEGQVQPKYSQTYTFYTTSDDGVRLWVNGVLLINNWTDHGPTENSGTIVLTAGTKYSIKMEYYENASGAVARLLWSSASQVKEVIPELQLYPLMSTLKITGTDPSKTNEVSVYPNPAKSEITIGVENGFINGITIFNTIGSIIYQEHHVLKKQVLLDVSNFAVGLHFIKIETDDNKIVVKKVIVVK